MEAMMSDDYVDLPYLKRQDETYFVRLWSPPKSVETKAVLVDVHGGAWCDHDRKAGYIYDKQLAQAGYAVAAIDFRCGPAFQHPAASIDVNAAVHWARLLARHIQARSQEVVTIGSSSGGHLALLAALTPYAEEEHGTEIWAKDEWTSPRSIDGSVPAVGAFWAPVDPAARFMYAKALDNQLGRRLMTNSIAYFESEEAMREASISRVVSEETTARLPRIWFAQAGNDQNVPAEIVQNLEQAYRTAGGVFEITTYPGSPHGFVHAGGEASQKFIRDLVSWLDAIFEARSST
ncbi:MAG: alpha/beta hydrolase [Actinomycetota bacterium]|nr:alpha/beta hydrolase [Actinomycetota bacterium]